MRNKECLKAVCRENNMNYIRKAEKEKKNSAIMGKFNMNNLKMKSHRGVKI